MLHPNDTRAEQSGCVWGWAPLARELTTTAERFCACGAGTPCLRCPMHRAAVQTEVHNWTPPQPMRRLGRLPAGRVFLHPSSVNFSCGGCRFTRLENPSTNARAGEAGGAFAVGAGCAARPLPCFRARVTPIVCCAGKFESGWLAYSEIVETSKVRGSNEGFEEQGEKQHAEQQQAGPRQQE